MFGCSVGGDTFDFDCIRPDRTILINIRNRIQVSKSTSVPYIWFTRWKWYLYSYVRIEVSKSTSIPYKYDLESKTDNCFHIKNTIQCKWRGYEKGLYKTWILPNRLFKKIKLYHYPLQTTSSFAFSNGANTVLNCHKEWVSKWFA